MGRPIIVEAAINGNAPRELNPNIPYTPQEIAGDAIAAAKAGAALIHFHVRDPESGRWVQDVPFLTMLKCTGAHGSLAGRSYGRRSLSTAPRLSASAISLSSPRIRQPGPIWVRLTSVL